MLEHAGGDPAFPSSIHPSSSRRCPWVVRTTEIIDSMQLVFASCWWREAATLA